MKGRMPLDLWYLRQAEVVAERSTCSRRHVGAIIVDANGYILAHGYNGVPSGFTHCTDEPCTGAFAESGAQLDQCQALHAEQNAVARLTQPLQAHTLYCTTAPCVSCTKLLLATATRRIIFLKPYPTNGSELWKRAGREWVHYVNTENA